jgi:peptide/nickel transport system permease protein
MTGPRPVQKRKATLGAVRAADQFDAEVVSRPNQTRRVWTLLRRLGFRRPVPPLLIVVGIVLVVTAAPAVGGGDALNQHLTAALQGPSPHFWLGTDEYGRDVLARVIAGTRTSLYASLAVVAISLGVGLVVGSLAAAVRGLGGRAISSLIDFVLGVPGVIAAIAVVGALGPGTRNIVIAFAALGWSWYARLAEEQARQLLAGRVVAVARISGVPAWQCVTGHVIPHVCRRLLVVACLDVGWVVVAIAGLGYLGLGAQPPAPELGQMMRDGQNYVLLAPWMILAPAGALMLVVLPFVAAGERVHARVLRV